MLWLNKQLLKDLLLQVFGWHNYRSKISDKPEESEFNLSLSLQELKVLFVCLDMYVT